eukprot:scaffold23390_cov74-Phaeocystis_antarctica.AAC.4
MCAIGGLEAGKIAWLPLGDQHELRRMWEEAERCRNVHAREDVEHGRGLRHVKCREDFVPKSVELLSASPKRRQGPAQWLTACTAPRAVSALDRPWYSTWHRDSSTGPGKHQWRQSAAALSLCALAGWSSLMGAERPNTLRTGTPRLRAAALPRCRIGCSLAAVTLRSDTQRLASIGAIGYSPSTVSKCPAKYSSHSTVALRGVAVLRLSRPAVAAWSRPSQTRLCGPSKIAPTFGQGAHKPSQQALAQRQSKPKQGRSTQALAGVAGLIWLAGQRHAPCWKSSTSASRSPLVFSELVWGAPLAYHLANRSLCELLACVAIHWLCSAAPPRRSTRWNLLRQVSYLPGGQRQKGTVPAASVARKSISLRSRHASCWKSWTLSESPMNEMVRLRRSRSIAAAPKGASMVF